MDLWSSTHREDAEYGIVPTSDDHEGPHGREEHLAETKGAVRNPAFVTKNRQNMLLAIFIAAACIVGFSMGLMASSLARGRYTDQSVHPDPDPDQNPSVFPEEPTSKANSSSLEHLTNSPTVAPEAHPRLSPTHGPTVAPTSLPTSSPSSLPMPKKASVPVKIPKENDPLFLPHLPYKNDKHYRRICAHVHSSILCLTLCFPFEAKQQDAHYNYPHPIDERFYDLDKHIANFIDGEDLLSCKNETRLMKTDEAVKHCLDSYTASLEQPENNVVSIWTRRRLDEAETQLYGVFMNEQQGARIDKFFDNHFVLAIGASPTPAIVNCLSTLFSNCQHGEMQETDVLCDKNHRKLSRTQFMYKDMPTSQVFLETYRQYPSGGRHHDMRMVNITRALKNGNDGMINFARDSGVKELRKLTLLFEYPLAHMQNQNEIMEEYEKTTEIQRKFPAALMEASSDSGRQLLEHEGSPLVNQLAVCFVCVCLRLESADTHLGIPVSGSCNGFDACCYYGRKSTASKPTLQVCMPLFFFSACFTLFHLTMNEHRNTVTK